MKCLNRYYRLETTAGTDKNSVWEKCAVWMCASIKHFREYDWERATILIELSLREARKESQQKCATVKSNRLISITALIIKTLV